MAEASTEAKMVPTFGLTGVTVNAMALIAPAPFCGSRSSFRLGTRIRLEWRCVRNFGAIILAYATALSYSELAKLYPGAGSSYLFAEKAFLNTTHAYRFARVAKFVTGWASHLYYWVYPGVMAATIGVMIGYIVGTLAPNWINPGIPGPVFMAIMAIISAYGIAYIAYRGVVGSTMVNIAINMIQIVALLFFSALAISYRLGHPDGVTGLALEATCKGYPLRFQRATTRRIPAPCRSSHRIISIR